MITDRELRLIGAEQEKLMPDEVTVQRRSNDDDGFGGRSDTTWADVVTLMARVTKAQTFDMGGQAGRKIEVEKWTVRFPMGTDVQEFDQIIFGAIVIRVDEVKLGAYKTVISIAGERVK